MLSEEDLAEVEPLSTSATDELLNVGEMIRRQALLTPQAIAVEGVDGTLTYQELYERAVGLAAGIQASGVDTGDRVAICLSRTTALPVALLGCILAQATYVPLDRHHPQSRNQFILDDAGVRVVITEHPADFPGHIALDPSQPPGSLPASSPTDDQPVYILYTSGSTGRPKGVVVPHRALANLLQGMQHLLQLGPQDRLLAVTTPAFDIAAVELYLPLVTGGRIVIAPEDVVGNGEKLSELAKSSQATVMQATPMTWRMLVEVGWRPHSSFTVLCGGESFPADLTTQLASTAAACWNLYGPTETTVWSLAHRVSGDERTVPIGRPVLNTRIRILDAHGRQVPVGLPGELYIGGSGVALGYTDPELTADRFVQGFYRTGDVVRQRPDGELEFLRRADRQVKLNGYRIELEEIEQVLRECETVQDCAVEVRGDPARLVAYVVSNADTTSLLEQVASRVPRYMVPATIVTLPALPTNANGKLDRNALPEPQSQEPSTASRATAPVGSLEAQLAHVWALVLGNVHIGVEDDFFAVGGHSLLALRLVSQIRTQMQLEIDLETVFDYPTIREMACALAESATA